MESTVSTYIDIKSACMKFKEYLQMLLGSHSICIVVLYRCRRTMV